MAKINSSQKFTTWPKTEFYKIELILRKSERTFINTLLYRINIGLHLIIFKLFPQSYVAIRYPTSINYQSKVQALTLKFWIQRFKFRTLISMEERRCYLFLANVALKVMFFFPLALSEFRQSNQVISVVLLSSSL